MTDLKTALWCDLTTDEERSAWLLLGRGYETGVVAKSMQSDLARAYQRLAQQEPVAWMYVNTDDECEQIEYGEPFDDPSVTPLYTAPPQREWVGLTEGDIYKISEKCGLMGAAWEDVMNAVEAKLKDKNDN